MNPESQCMSCDQPDNADNLVQCDKCDGFEHFSCAGVRDSIADADRSFTCRRCIEEEEVVTVSSHRSSRHSGSTSRSSMSAARLALKMKQLESEKQSRLKELEDAEKFQRLRRRVEADFDKQRFDVLQEQLRDDEENRSVRSRMSSRIVQQNTSRWIGTASQVEGRVRATSTNAVSLTPEDDNRSNLEPATSTLAGSFVSSVVVPVVQHDETVVEAGNNVIVEQGEVEPGVVGPVDRVGTTVNATEDARTTSSTTVVTPSQSQPQLGVTSQPTMSISRHVDAMGSCTGVVQVHFGTPIATGRSTENEVRCSVSNLNVGLQPIAKASTTSTPKQSSVAQMIRNKEIQLGSMGRKGQDHLSQHTFLDANESPPNIAARVSQPANNQRYQFNSSGLLPPPGHKQGIESKSSTLLPPPGHKQVIDPKSPRLPPPSGCKQGNVMDPALLQPPPRHKQNSETNTSTIPPPLGHNQCVVSQAQELPQPSRPIVNAVPDRPLPVHQSIPWNDSVLQPNQPIDPRSYGCENSRWERSVQSKVIHAESGQSFLGTHPGNQQSSEYLWQSAQQRCREPHSSVLLPSSGQQQYYVPTSSVLLPSSGQQQYQVPSSSVLVPTSGYQPFPARNPLAPVPPTGPEQPSASGDPNEQSIPMQQNGMDRTRSRLATGPTAEQLAARQVIPRELPVFSGDPQDWPLFFSSFRNSTEACGYNDAENLARLQRCLRGHALDSVRSRLLIPESVPHVMSTLERLYGRPEIIIYSLLKRMREIPSPKGDDLKTLIKFGMGVGNLVDHMTIANQRQHISNPMLLQEMVDRLPPNLKLQWASFKRAYYTVDLETFNNFMAELVTMASEVTLHVDPGHQSIARSEKGKRETPTKEKLFVHQQPPSKSGAETNKPQQKESATKTPNPCFHCDRSDHRIAECPDFKKLNMDERWKVTREKGLCRICLIPHRSWPCRSKQECGIGDCRMRHHPLLHSRKPESSSPSPSTSTPSSVVHQHHHSMTSSALLRYLPVTLYGNGKSVDVYAFLDDGSSSTMLEAEVASLLGVGGPREPLCLCWTGEVTRIEKESQRIEITVAGQGEKKHFPLKARTVGQLKLPSQTVDCAELYEHHPYLKNIPLCSYAKVAPRLIIGVDNARLISALKSRESGTGELVAAKTRLGWCVYGRYSSNSRVVENVNVHVERNEKDSELHDLFRQFLAIEEASIKHSPQSEEDKRALKILQETTRRVDGKLETALLWRYDEPCLPNSYPMAIRRMEALERKLSKDPYLDEKVRDQIAGYIEKGYAHRITPEELESTEPGRVWYLPLGVVSNPRKPGKVRLIWDAAARVDGVSFNDMMLKGPDMLTALPDVLLRFRQKSVAFSGDIREMFHQYLIRKRDKQAQRFVFRERPGHPPQIFVMDVATFGAACSPCIAQYLKNMNAEEYAEQFPEAARAIIENHYVDDYLDSVDTVDEAVRLIEEVKYVHSLAGMEIRNFVSNSAEVLDRIGECSKVQEKSMNLEAYVERVLGMVWKPSEDVFSFDNSMKEEVRSIVENHAAPTKRQVLRAIMSLFDPLGFVAHFSVHGKIIMQRIWRSGLDWDEPISGEILEDWYKWSGLLAKINEVRVPRCFFSGPAVTPKDSQIHVFVDASENAYACVAYLRSCVDGTPRCTLIEAKTKVAPLKPLSIPRLELQAALIGSRLLDSICKALTIPVAARYLWSDSSTVLAWLRSETRRYHQFVGFRVGEILSTTTVDEWHKVPSKVNIADQATKWGDGPIFNPAACWYTGPSFLRESEETWQTNTTRQFTTEEDLRAVCHHHRALSQPVIDVERFSKWSRLHRAVGYVVKAFKRFQGMKADGPLTQEELQEAEVMIWRQAQMQEYADEHATLVYNKEHPDAEPKQIDRSCALYRMSPMLDDDGVLRMNSRIAAAPMVTNDAKFPIFLPKGHRVTELLVDSYHVRFLHGNNETVVNEIRQRFRIPQLRAVVAKVAKLCQHCRIQKAEPRAPIMAPLPEIRLTAFIRPFTHTGVDYFGPVFVKQGRSLVKRWVALFTCLSIRAVHLEIVHSLSTQSCVMAVRRFVARRGSPATFFSDNGTNFVGAKNLLQEQLRVISEHCAVTFTNSNTRWMFNPPLAPHMGGPWERMVRSVKTAMAAIADHPHHPSDEVLETVVLEAESIVNSRPLTYIPLDHEEQEALTPNHFLLYGTKGVNQPLRDFAEDAAILRDSWKLAQHLVDTFWSRWIREYLPTLTRRTKWFQPVKPLKPGDLVVVVDEGKRNGWVRGRIMDVTKAMDGQVRRAVVHTARGSISRPATKLALLDVASRKPETVVSGVPELHGRGDVGEPTVQPSPTVK